LREKSDIFTTHAIIKGKHLGVEIVPIASVHAEILPIWCGKKWRPRGLRGPMSIVRNVTAKLLAKE